MFTDVFQMPVLIDSTAVLVRNHCSTIGLVRLRDVETLLAIFHDAIANQAPMLKWLVFEQRHVYLFARICAQNNRIPSPQVFISYL